MPWSREEIWCKSEVFTISPETCECSTLLFQTYFCWPQLWKNHPVPKLIWYVEKSTINSGRVLSEHSYLNTLYIWLSVLVHLSLELFSVLFLQLLFHHCSFWMYFSHERNWDERCKRWPRSILPNATSHMPSQGGQDSFSWFCTFCFILPNNWRFWIATKWDWNEFSCRISIIFWGK